MTDIHSSDLISITDFLEYAQTLRDSGSREGEARATAGGVVQIMSIHETGYIDLLYLRDGLWTLVDFKTDRARTEADFQKLLLEKGYQAQVGRYGTAVTQLMGVKAQLKLCFLNAGDEVRLVDW